MSGILYQSEFITPRLTGIAQHLAGDGRAQSLLVDPAISALAAKLAGIPRALDKVLARTANKVAEGARGQAVKLISGHYALKQKDLREKFRIHRANWKIPVAVLSTAGPQAVSLSRWNPTPGPGGRRPPVGLRVRILRGGAAKPVPGAFWMPSSGSHSVMKREGLSRLPLEKLFGPSFLTFYRRKETLEEMRTYIADRLVKVLPQQVRYVLLKGQEGPDA